MNNIALARHEFVIKNFQHWSVIEDAWQYFYRFKKDDTLIQWIPEVMEMQIGITNETDWRFIYKCSTDTLYLVNDKQNDRVNTDLKEVCDAINAGGVTGVQGLYDLKLVEERLC